jgi:hypothetical protein
VFLRAAGGQLYLSTPTSIFWRQLSILSSYLYSGTLTWWYCGVTTESPSVCSVDLSECSAEPAK